MLSHMTGGDEGGGCEARSGWGSGLCSGLCSEAASERGRIVGVFSSSNFGVGVGELFCTSAAQGCSGKIAGAGVETGEVSSCGVATVEELGD